MTGSAAGSISATGPVGAVDPASAVGSAGTVAQVGATDPASAVGSAGVVAAARDLLTGLERNPWGEVSPSVYETARLVALAPWLPGHDERVRWLLARQRPDGGWGQPGGYGLVPTLSATDALLATALADPDGRWSHPSSVSVPVATLARAVERGLRLLTAVADWSLPDTPAVDLIAPALVARIEDRLARLPDRPVGALEAWRAARPLPLPAGLTTARLEYVRRLHAAGRPLPDKLLHALEVLGDGARRAAGVRPRGPGAVGASPAATAAWIGEPEDADRRALGYLDEVRRRHGELAPCATPITVFERAWVLSTLAGAGVPVEVPGRLADELAAALGPEGAATGPGLPTDADTTAVVLHALALLGRPVPPDSLWRYDLGDHFCTWPGEDGASVTTNAHVLDALGWHHRFGAPGQRRYADAIRGVSRWLIGQQRPDGSWLDRWHASPYYATCCAVLALVGSAPGPATAESVARAVSWVLETVGADGGWGIGTATAEETAYAIRVLLVGTTVINSEADDAVRGGLSFLSRNGAGSDGPPLWHDKDLYYPAAIVRSAILAATHLARPSRVEGDGDPTPRDDRMIRSA